MSLKLRVMSARGGGAVRAGGAALEKYLFKELFKY